MAMRDSVDVRIIASKELVDDFLAAMNESMKREGWRLIKQPSYRASKKEPDDVLVYTEWIKQKQ